MDPNNVVSVASNLRTENTDQVTAEEFLLLYPQFGSEAVSQAALDTMLDISNHALNENRWRTKWKLGVCLYTAHLLTMWLKSAASPTDPVSTIITKGDSKGAMTSKSVGGVSVSYGSTSGDSDLAGFGNLRDTIYGQQLATMAKFVGKGMVVIR